MLVVIGVALCFIIVPLVYLIAGAGAGLLDIRHLSVEQTLIAGAIGYVPLAALLLAVLPRVAKASLHELGFHAPSQGELAVGLAGIIAMWLVVTLVGTLISTLAHKHEAEAAVALMRQLRSPGEKVFYAFIAIALAPMLEELTFRVFLFNAFSRYMPLAWAALCSGVVFGIVHAQGTSGANYATQLLTVSVSLALGGIILAYVYSLTRCYWCSVITHAGFNAITVFAVIFLHAR